MHAYYRDKLESLRDIFGTEVALHDDKLSVGGVFFPIVDDVIVLLDPAQYTPLVKSRVGAAAGQGGAPPAHDALVQYSFGEEWTRFSEILPEHEREFAAYFDLVDFDKYKDARVCDLGCGIGRWAKFWEGRCRERVLVDFSDAIFVARENLRGSSDALFFMADLQALPFREGFAELIYCLGVLHHLPVDALAATRALAPLTEKDLLVYLYYALDNRPAYFRALLSLVTAVRRGTSRVRSPAFRSVFSLAGALGIYKPLVLLGAALSPLGMKKYIPLAEAYAGKSVQRIRQDVYDRFFTSIEQRVSRAQIAALEDTFTTVRVSENPPYWHFLCGRS